MKRNRKCKTPHTVLERQTLCFSSYNNHKLTVKRWWVGVRERKKRAFFVPFNFSEGDFFNICVLSQCIVHWIHFQNIYSFTCQKPLLHTLLLLVFEIVESLKCILKYVAKREHVICSNKCRCEWKFISWSIKQEVDCDLSVCVLNLQVAQSSTNNFY